MKRMPLLAMTVLALLFTQSKKDETKEEATEDGSAASVGSVEREDDFVQGNRARSGTFACARASYG